MKKLTTAEFIQKANTVHNNKYTYNSTKYVSSLIKVSIECTKHGTFFQKPNAHLQGRGCKMCGGCVESNTIDFVNKSNIIHDTRYNYSNTDYVNTHTKIEIICLEHGSFTQRPNDHLKGNGCPMCVNNRKSCTESFVSRSNNIHEYKYGYTSTTYTTNNIPVTITCYIHGDFTQRPHDHLNGHGCKKCNQIGGYNLNRLTVDSQVGQRLGSLYFVSLKSSDEHFYKIGISSGVNHRLAYMSTSYICTPIRIVNMTMLDAFILEQNVLSKFAQYSPTHKFGGHTECLRLSGVEVNAIIDMIQKNIQHL